MWAGPQIATIECDGFTGMMQMNPPFMSKTSALHEHHACLYFASSFTARLRRKTSVCDVLCSCLLYTSDAADEEDSVDLGGRRIIKKKNKALSTRIRNTHPHEAYLNLFRPST